MNLPLVPDAHHRDTLEDLVRRIRSAGFDAAVVAHHLCVWTPIHTACCTAPSLVAFTPVDAGGGGGDITYPQRTCFACGDAQIVRRSASIEVGAVEDMSVLVTATLSAWRAADAQQRSAVRQAA